MNKNILSYYNGIVTFYHHLSYISGVDSNPYLVFDKNNINNALVATIATFFLTLKEDIVDKEENLKYSSKVVEEALSLSVECIAQKIEKGYLLDNHLFSNPSTLIATLRNKFAHGDYEVDEENEQVIINKDNEKININISNLTNLIINAIKTLIKYPKTSKKERIITYLKNPSQFMTEIKNEQQIEEFIKSTITKNYILESNDSTLLSNDMLDLFEYNIQKEKTYQNDTEQLKKLKYTFDLTSKLNNCTYKIDETKVTEKEYIEEIKKIFMREECCFNMKVEEQIYQLINIVRKFILEKQQETNKIKRENLIAGSLNNIIRLETIKNGSIKIKGNAKQAKLFLNETIAEQFLFCLLSEFNALYIYPFDNLYKKELTENGNYFDFSKLDLSMFNIEKSKTSSEDNELNNKINNKMKNYYEIKNKIEAQKSNLENIDKENNQKGFLIVSKIIKELEEKCEKIMEEYYQLKNQYDIQQNKYLDINKYIENKGIIEGIRNAIAHGNVFINKYENVKTVDDMSITFKDIYENNEVFNLTAKVSDFENLFNKENIEVICQFLNKEKNKTIVK